MKKKTKPGAIQQLLSYAGNNKKQLYLSTFLATLGELFGMAPFITVSLLVAELFNKTATIQNVCILFAVALGGQILKLWLTYQSSFMSHKATYKILKNIRSKIADKMLRVPMGVMLDTPTGNFKNLMADTVSKLEDSMAHFMPEITSNVVAPLCCILLVFILDWRMGLAALITIPLGLLGYIGMMNDYVNKSTTYMKSQNAMNSNLDIHTILQVREILSALKAAGHTIIVSEHRLFYLYGLADRFLIMEDGQICEELTGEEMAELSAVQMHNRRLRPLNLDLIQIERKESICRSEVFLQIRNLSFSHKAMPELLHNISLEAYKGETIALIGENGCGKTTLGKILSGLIRCRQGAFYIDGKNVKQQKLSDYVYFVMQEADHQLYTDSVTEELRLGNKRIPSIDEKVSQILKMLHLENFKDCHPYALSGGQKQRLTIGAAMLSEKPIIVLDEPTSGLDWDNMCAVANAVNYMREAGKLVFIITHDLEFISLTASRALLLKEGIIKDDLQMTEQNNFKIVKNFMVEEGGE